QTPPPLRTLVDNLPPKAEAAVMRALQKDPSERFQTARAFSHALDECLAELATPSPSTHRREAQTSSRTAVNLELQDVQRLPGRRARRLALPKVSRRAAAIALAVPALVAGGVLAWPHLSQLEALA